MQAVPSLAVPVDEVRKIRAKTDDNWEAAFLGELRQVLKPDGLKAVLQAFLCFPNRRKPLLVVGLESAEEAAAGTEAGRAVVCPPALPLSAEADLRHL